MIPEAPQQAPEAAGSPQKASQQLRDCSHLIGLLADQLEALEQQDLRRFRELETLRSRLVEELGKQAEPEMPLLMWIAGKLDEAFSQVESWIQLDQSKRDQLAQLQNDSLPLVRGIQARVGSGNYVSLGSGHANLDLRL